MSSANARTTRKKIIALCGFAGSGKDSAAAALIKHKGYTKLSFATLLKDILSVLFGWDRNALEGTTKEDREWREQVDSWWAAKLGIETFSPRYAMQQIGTNLFRDHFHKDIWVLALERSLSRYSRVVITDCRFPNEIEMVKSHGANLVKVHRPSVTPSLGANSHVSETGWINQVFDFEVVNDGDLEDLCREMLLIEGICV